MANFVPTSEVLLVGCSSSDPFSTLIIDPRTGVSSWSYKGTELQGGCIDKVAPVGINGEHIAISMKKHPFVHFIGVNTQKKFHERATVGGVVIDFTTTSDGCLMFIAVDRRILIFLLTSGELICAREVHLQELTNLQLSEDNSTLVSSSQDGCVKVHLVSELISETGASYGALREWRAHSLSVTGLSLTSSSSLRVASCSLDHTATIHSVALDLCLLRVSADRALTSCLLCPSESRFFLSSDRGVIACLSLYSIGQKDTREVLLSTTNPSPSDFILQGHHTTAVKQLALNSDGCILASGDLSGKYVVWQVASKQTLKVSSLHGPISSLSFVPPWKSLSGETDEKAARPCFDKLARSTSERTSISLLRRTPLNTHDDWLSVVEDALKSGVSKESHPIADKTKEKAPVREDSATNNKEIASLRKEVVKLKQINRQMFDYASKELAGPR